MEVSTEMYEAKPELAEYVNSVVQKFLQEGAAADGKVSLTVSMSLAITLCAQVFLAAGGDILKAEEIAELVKVGMISTLGAYRDLRKQNHPGSGKRQ